jgi:hypothetical protein
MKRILFSTAASVILFLSPNLLFSQTVPNLNSADSFVLFTGNGNLTSTSPFTIVVGNVGNKAGTASAFPPGFLSGSKHFNDATATQVTADVAAAYTDLAGRTCGTAHGVTFGSETLTAGVYCATAASSLNGNLTLDGQGNASSVFIIKVDGAFSSAPGAQIILLNGAASCNVFWQINGTVVLDNTVFRGTILANGAVTLNTNTIIDGRVLTNTGNFTFGSVIVSICDISLLPMQLINFDVAKTTDDNVLVSWITTSEVNVAGYEVQVSVSGSPFVKVGFVSAKGNGFPTRYDLPDLQANKTGVRLYRLKMMDKDGSFTYSFVRSLKFSDLRIGLINIFPNPAGNTINISVNAQAKEHVTLAIVNMHGQRVIQKTLLVDKGINTITEDIRNLTNATYILSIKNLGTGEETRQNFQKL